jgi:iron(III) transport system permease protein
LAVILMVVVFLLLWLERGQRGRRRFAAAAGGEAMVARRALGPLGTLLAWVCCGLPLVLGFGLPALRLVLWSWQSWEGHDWVGHWQAAFRSFGLAASTAGLIVAGALVLVGGLRADPCGASRWARRIGVAGYAFPSALVAVGVGAWVGILSGPLPMLALSASAFGLLAAYFIRYLAVGVQPLAAGFDRTPPDFHEAARSLGSRPLAALWRVDFPLAWPAILAGATLAFLDVFKELPLTLVLRPFDFETLATRAYRLTDEGRIPEAALPGLALVCLSLAGLIPLTRMLRQPS